MSTTIKINVTAAGRGFELTHKEARVLYEKLRQGLRHEGIHLSPWDRAENDECTYLAHHKSQAS